MANGDKLGRKEEVAIAALLGEPTVEAAAQKAGISSRTLRTWMAQEGFAKAYKAARAAVVDNALAGLQRAGDEAVATLVRNMTCGEYAVEIRAARTVLELTTKLRESNEFEDRLREIEARMKG